MRDVLNVPHVRLIFGEYEADFEFVRLFLVPARIICAFFRKLCVAFFH
jgi:hypothetical protein